MKMNCYIISIFNICMYVLYFQSSTILFFSFKKPILWKWVVELFVLYIYIYIYHYTALKIFTLAELTSLQKMKSLTSLLVHMHHPLASDMKHALLPMSTWLLNAQPHEVRGAPTTSLTTQLKYKQWANLIGY